MHFTFVCLLTPEGQTVFDRRGGGCGFVFLVTKDVFAVYRLLINKCIFASQSRLLFSNESYGKPAARQPGLLGVNHRC